MDIWSISLEMKTWPISHSSTGSSIGNDLDFINISTSSQRPPVYVTALFLSLMSIDWSSAQLLYFKETSTLQHIRKKIILLPDWTVQFYINVISNWIESYVVTGLSKHINSLSGSRSYIHQQVVYSPHLLCNRTTIIQVGEPLRN